MHDALVAWLLTAAARLHAEAPGLTALDQAIGDGDHGINMDRGFSAIVGKLDSLALDPAADDTAATADLLRLAGRTLISTVGGAAGPLYGTAFLRAAGAVAAGGATSSAAAYVAAIEAAATGIGALGKSTTGEKTMLDAIVPAAVAARAALETSDDIATVTAAAAVAAERGADATIPMLATKGRASYLGERSIGHRDPGASSAVILLRLLAETAGATTGAGSVSERST
ncbi:MAG: dihydroxyacetone kinase subunit L [Chloroflexi bacterium]|nr:dihydroxyacetone kinase subunit L [Chloroflexota bacterium]